VAELKPVGTRLVYSTNLGGSGFDYGSGIAVDASGDAYVIGATSSTDFASCPASSRVAGSDPCTSTTGTALQSINHNFRRLQRLRGTTNH